MLSDSWRRHLDDRRHVRRPMPPASTRRSWKPRSSPPRRSPSWPWNAARPLLVQTVYNALRTKPVEILKEAGIPVFVWAEPAVQCIAELVAYAKATSPQPRPSRWSQPAGPAARGQRHPRGTDRRRPRCLFRAGGQEPARRLRGHGAAAIRRPQRGRPGPGPGRARRRAHGHEDHQRGHPAQVRRRRREAEGLRRSGLARELPSDPAERRPPTRPTRRSTACWWPPWRSPASR